LIRDASDRAGSLDRYRPCAHGSSWTWTDAEWSAAVNGRHVSVPRYLRWRGYSTVGDFLRFAAALRSHKLLDAHYTELLTSGEVITPRPGIRYAFGFEDETIPDGVRLYGHGGGSPGMNGRLPIFRKSGYVVVALSNLDPPAADAIAQFIDERLPAR